MNDFGRLDNLDTGGAISFVKGDTSGLGFQSLRPDLAGIDVNANWVASSSGRKGLAGRLSRGRGQDLDLVAVLSQGQGPKRLCWYDDMDPFDNRSVLSQGDDRKGRGGETIVTTWAGIPANIDRITYILAAFKQGVSFASVNRVTVNVTGVDGSEIGVFMPDIDAGQNALIIGQAEKVNGVWGYKDENAMATIPRNAALDPGPEFKAGILRVARQWYTQGN